MTENDILQLYDSGGWFKVHRDFFLICNPAEAMVLAWLFSQRALSKTEDGWFRVGQEKLEKELNLDERRQRQVLSQLAGKGLLKTKRQGLPAKRYVRLDLFCIYSSVGEIKQRLDGAPSPKNKQEPDRLKMSGLDRLKMSGLHRLKMSGNSALLRNAPYKTLNNKTVAPCGRNGVHGVFFDQIQQHHPFDEKAAIKLEKAIAKKRKIQRKPNRREWIDHFRKLREVDQIPKKRIKMVLLWYVSNFGGQFIPKVYSAKTFREKFLHIEDAMEREQPKTKAKQPAKELSKDAARLLEQLNARLVWPKGAGQQLPGVVQESMEQFKSWKAKRKQVFANLRKLDGDQYRTVLAFEDYFSSITGTDPVEFLFRWFSDVFNRVANWEGWSGDLSYFKFTPTSKQLDSLGHSLSQQWAQTGKVWEQYKQLLNEN